tara:strand:+ start:678 stop:2243 length:1566 start_codon:yes stop_codon:yes gene_type:complete
MAEITKEIAKKDAQKLFDSIGRFTGSGWVTTGEKGNTVVELKKIIKKYKDSADLDLLESAYEQIYKTGIETTLKGEFTGQQRLQDRFDKLRKENPNKSLLELDLIDEGREYSKIKRDEQGSITTSLFTNVADLYSKHKDSVPERTELPNQDITLEQITERFQGGDKTIPLDEDAINALDSTKAIDIIIDNKLPLTDEGRGTLAGFLKFAPEDKVKKFRSIYFPQEEEVVTEQPTLPLDEREDVRPVGEQPIIDQDEDAIPDTVDIDAGTGTDKTVVTKQKKVKDTPQNRAQTIGNAGKSLLQGAASIIDNIGGPGAIISYVMGKKGLKAAMKQIEPQARPELSPAFMQHLRQTKELAKQGFHPDEEVAFRKELDKSYQIGLENAVRGSAGQRARFLAQSGVLDAQRSSALLDFAVRDNEIQRKNADKYEKMMLFKENFDIQKTEQDRLEDIKRQEANKSAAAKFTSAAFTNALSGLKKTNVGAIVNTFLGANPNTNKINQVNPIDYTAAGKFFQGLQNKNN